MQQNSKCSDRDETINHIISKCCKLEQRENKTRHDWVGKVIYWDLCEKFKFDNTNKSVQENETLKILRDFKLETDHIISVWCPNLVKVNNNNKKEKLPNSGLCRSGWLWSKTERK